MALAVLSIVFTLGVAAFASLPSVSPSRAKDAVAARRTPAK
jgi:hypothetical protein